MRTNEAPEKVYFTSNENGSYYYTEGIPFEREYIEYTRTDAFIEMACKFLNSSSILKNTKVVEMFKNYIKGE